MKQIGTIARKEFKDYFVSPIAYIVISIFLAATGWLFFSSFFLYNTADMRNFFSLLPIIFSFVIPAVTMRQFAEEINTGSYEILLTMPVTQPDIIVGKFFAATAFILIMLLSTITYPISIAFIGTIDPGPVIGGYFGSLLLGSAYAAIGLFASALTRNQIIAFMTGSAICVTLTMIGKMLLFVPVPLVDTLSYLGVDSHFGNIARGVVDTRDIIYFLSVIFMGLYAANLAIQEKK